MTENLHPLLVKLKLRGMKRVIDSEMERAQRQGSGLPEVIYRLLVEEDRYRQERSLEYRLQQAKIPCNWTLQTFPFERKPDLNRTQIQTLAGLSFVERAQNVVFIGDPGTGKTLSRYAVLLIDEVGYLTLKPEQVNAFFRLMEQRYGHTATIITTNLEYNDWYSLFQRKSLVDALLNRLRHYCVPIHVPGPPLRVPQEQDQSSVPSS